MDVQEEEKSKANDSSLKIGLSHSIGRGRRISGEAGQRLEKERKTRIHFSGRVLKGKSSWN